jgi:hypothetical protein
MATSAAAESISAEAAFTPARLSHGWDMERRLSRPETLLWRLRRLYGEPRQSLDLPLYVLGDRRLYPPAHASTAGSVFMVNWLARFFLQQLLSENRNPCYGFAMTSPIKNPDVQAAAERGSAHIVHHHDGVNPPCSNKRKKRPGGRRKPLKRLDSDKEIQGFFLWLSLLGFGEFGPAWENLDLVWATAAAPAPTATGARSRCATWRNL